MLLEDDTHYVLTSLYRKARITEHELEDAVGRPGYVSNWSGLGSVFLLFDEPMSVKGCHYTGVYVSARDLELI